MPTTTGKATEFITFSRTSNATLVDADGRIKWAPHNLLTNSESFDAAAWTKTNVTVTANAVAAPNGTTTADKIVETATTAQHGINAISSLLGDFTLAVFVKAAERNWFVINQGNLANGAVWFDVSNGVVGTKQSAVNTATITSVGNGWYLCTATYTLIGAGYNPAFLVTNADNVFSYLGDITKGIYVWGAHYYRSDLGGMQANTSAYPMYNPTTPRNFFGHSEIFATSWVAQNGSVTSNTTLSPGGLQTAATFTAAAGTAQVQVYQTLGITTNPKTISVYLKAGTHGIVQYRFTGDATSYANFDLINGVTGASGGTLTSQIAAIGNGWYRCSVIHTAATATSFYVNMVPAVSSARGANLVAAGTETIYLWGAQLSDSASLDPYVPVYGAAVTSAAYYGPRRDFDPVTLACRGLLVEEQRANLLLRSDAFDNASWVKSAATVTANAGVSPDGASTADKIVENTATTGHSIYQTVAVSNATAYTFSVFAKASGRSQMQMQYFDGTTNKYPIFDLTTGVKVTDNGIGSSWTATSVGNGWWRFTITVTSAGTSADCYLYPASSGAVNYTGNGTDGILVWGAQLEAGSFATSYIPTGAATATRNADVASVATSAFPYSSTASTLVAAVSAIGAGGGSSIVELSASAAANGLLFYQSTGSLQMNAYVDSSVVNLGTATTNAVQKLGLAYDGVANGAVRNGGAVSSVGTTVSAAANKLGIGSSFGGVYQFNGHIRQITYLPRRLPNAELQSRSA